MGGGESCRTARSGWCPAETWACRSMSERTAGGREREKESHAGQRGVVGALRERGHAGPCPSAQARFGGGLGYSQARVGYGQVRDSCGRVRVRSASGRLGRQESCGARLGRAGSEVCRIRVRVKAQVNVSVSGMSEAWLRAGPGLLMRACEIIPSLMALVAAWR